MNHTAIFKGVDVKVMYNDWSHGQRQFNSQNAAKAYVNGLDLTEVHRIILQPVWSAPGERVTVEVHQQGEDDRRDEIARTNDRELERIKEHKRKTEYDVDQTLLGFPPAGD